MRGPALGCIAGSLTTIAVITIGACGGGTKEPRAPTTGGAAVGSAATFDESTLDEHERALRETAKTDTRSLLSIVDAWRLNNPGDRCPTLEDLERDRYLKAGQNAADPWGKPYRVVCSDTDYGVVSGGADGVVGTPDDLWAGARPK